MADRIGDVPLAGAPELVFPKLTQAQFDRIAAHGHRRTVNAGEVLVEQGAPTIPFFLVVSGELESVRILGDRATVAAIVGPNQFTGEVNSVSGRHSLLRLYVTKPGEVFELDRASLFALIQSDAELSEILLRAFILRRVALVTAGVGDVVLIGSMHSADTLRIKEFLTRNGHPYAYVDLDGNADVEEMMKAFDLSVSEIPVIICRGQVALRNPNNREIADCLGFNESIDAKQIRDLVVVGAGPAGLAAAVYGASEGLDVLIIETNAPGGQAGSSSRIENYLGFPTGVSGGELAARAFAQAEKFGAQMLMTSGVRLDCDRAPYHVRIEDGTSVPARSIAIATGIEYRKLNVENLAQFEGAGVYYGATYVEAQLCRGEDVIVVGGGNSAGQAAVFLAQSSKTVHILIRADGLAESMSRYLSRRIEDAPNIRLHPNTEIVGMEGDGRLERVVWHNGKTGATETREIGHVFVMTGGNPNTTWVDGCLTLDASGFIKTGSTLTSEDLSAAHWPLSRHPSMLETSLPGVFAIGDVRSGSVKRVASAVGEGSIAISFVHQFLRD